VAVPELRRPRGRLNCEVSRGWDPRWKAPQRARGQPLPSSNVGKACRAAAYELAVGLATLRAKVFPSSSRYAGSKLSDGLGRRERCRTCNSSCSTVPARRGVRRLHPARESPRRMPAGTNRRSLARIDHVPAPRIGILVDKPGDRHEGAACRELHESGAHRLERGARPQCRIKACLPRYACWRQIRLDNARASARHESFPR
jgi:hypothetical protein